MSYLVPALKTITTLVICGHEIPLSSANDTKNFRKLYQDVSLEPSALIPKHVTHD